MPIARRSINYYDCGFYQLPNSLSHETFDFEELVETVNQIISGNAGPAGGEDRKTLMASFLAALDGPLASERIVDVLERDRGAYHRAHKNHRYRHGYTDDTWRANAAWSSDLSHIFRHRKYRPEFQRYRYPGISLGELSSRVRRLQDLLGETEPLTVEQLSDYVFRIVQ